MEANDLTNAFKTAIGMSLISMIAMEAAMNITDVILTGGLFLLVGNTVYACSRICYTSSL